MLDRISYRIHAFAFPVWTFAVLITGPIWAHQAWSSYWNWDPKEVWAFITWVVYAAYLHARSTAGWKGRNAALLALVGLATLWFNFIGINYFSSTSQHSYAAGAGPAVVEVQRPLGAEPGAYVVSGSSGCSGCLRFRSRSRRKSGSSSGPSGRGGCGPSARGAGSPRRWIDADGEVDHHRDEDHHQQELQHPSNVGARMVTPTLNG